MNTSTVSSSSESSVLRSAGLMGLATFISRILGLVREQVFAILFGAGNATDAYNVAFRIPNLLRDLFAEGAMSASLVPVFTRAQEQEGPRRAWRIAGLVFRVLFLGVSLLTVAGIFFAPQLVELYASAYHAVPGKFELTVQMTRIIFPFFPLVALAAAYMGVLNACGIFFMPAFASALFNVASVLVGGGFALLLFRVGPQYGIHPIMGMAVGVVAGGLVQAFSQLPALYKAGYRWPGKEASDPAWHQDPALRRMLVMMVPGTVGLAATQINILVNTVLATSQGPGPVSWLNYAFRLMQFPIGVFGVSLAAATLPAVSRKWVNQDLAGVRETLQSSLRQVFAINLPASAGLAFLGIPIVQLIFQYGAFTPEDARATAMALVMYSVGLTAYSAVKVLVPACYALGNTRLPVIASFLTVGMTIALNLAMIRPFGYWGLALGTSIAAVFNGCFLLVALRGFLAEKGEGFPLFPLAVAFARHLGIALGMGLACLFSHQILDLWLPDRILLESLGKSGLVLSRGLKLGSVVFEGLVIVVVLAKVFGVKDTTDAFDLFSKKIKNKLSRGRT